MSDKDIDVRAFNRDAWNRQVGGGNEWTIPVDAKTIADARIGDWSIVLTPQIPVPADWFPPLPGAEVLCLASGGGQQGPVLSAAGAKVTVYDNSPSQLEVDRNVAERENLDIRTVEGDMRDLSLFDDATFDLIFHPVSNVFIPNILPVWREAYRVLRPGGTLLSGFDNPLMFLFDVPAYEAGKFVVAHKLPYSDTNSLSEEEIAARRDRGEPFEFGHTLDDQIGGQIEAGFLISGFYEDRFSPEVDLLSRYIATFVATRAIKPSGA